jgi:hypothetical protein
MEKDIEVQEENVVSYVKELDTHYEISGFVHITFNGKKHEIDFTKSVNK